MGDLSSFLLAANGNPEGFAPRPRGLRETKVFVRPGYNVTIGSAGGGGVTVEAVENVPYLSPRAVGRSFACGELATGYPKLCEAFAGLGGMTAAIKPHDGRMYLFAGEGKEGHFERLYVAEPLEPRTCAEASLLNALRRAGAGGGVGGGAGGGAGAGEGCASCVGPDVEEVGPEEDVFGE